MEKRGESEVAAKLPATRLLATLGVTVALLGFGGIQDAWAAGTDAEPANGASPAASASPEAGGSPEGGDDAIGDPESPRYSELEKRDRATFRETWVLPGTDFSRYDSILIWQAQFEYRDVGPAESTRSTTLRTRKREFGISDKDRAEVERIVSEAFEKEIQKGKRFEVVDDAGENTLILRGALLDVVSFVPPPTVGRSDVYLASIGEATVTIELMDAQTGTVLALVSERIKVEPPGGRIDRFSMPANRVTVMADIRRAASSVAARLRKALDDALEN